MASIINSVRPNGEYAPHIQLAMFVQNRAKLIDRLVATGKLGQNDAVILQGGTERNREDSDTDWIFRQCSHFFYLFGLNEPDCYGVIDLAKKETLLFIPRVDASYEVVCGKAKPTSFYVEKYGANFVSYVDEMAGVLANRGIKVLHTMSGVNTDSGKSPIQVAFKGIEQFTVNSQILFTELVECRVFKSPLEIELMRYVNKISSLAHTKLMQQIRPGMSEHEVEALFIFESHRNGGCRHLAYTPICASGKNCAVLHYGHAGAPNDKGIVDGDFILADMGAEYYCYASDITCTFPANGVFSPEQKAIYETVLHQLQAVLAELKPGVRWSDMHKLADRILVEHLAKLDLIRLQGETADVLARKYHIAALFCPCGLGHLIGLDVHDVGGYPPHEEKRIDEPGLRRLRTNRLLKPGMVLTVEPGVYFMDVLLEPAFKDPVLSKYLNEEKIRKFMHIGGVRLEDDVVITDTGIDNLTHVPRTVEEIEGVMAGKEWKY